MSTKIFLKGEQDLEKDITVECSNEHTMTNEEFEKVFNQISCSSMAFACSSRATAADAAEKLCKIAGFECDAAYNHLRSKFGRLWNYTGD